MPRSRTRCSTCSRRCASTARSARPRGPGKVVSPRLGFAQALGVGARQPAGAVDPGQARPPDAVRRTAALGRAPGPGAHDAARRGAAPGAATGVRARRRCQRTTCSSSRRATTWRCRSCRPWPRRSHGLHLGLRFAGSEEALRSLLDGRCRVAGFHVPRLAQAAPVFSRALRPLLKPGTHKLIGSHWRRQGLMHRPGTPPPALADLGGRSRAARRRCASSTASPARARGCCSTT